MTPNQIVDLPAPPLDFWLALGLLVCMLALAGLELLGGAQRRK